MQNVITTLLAKVEKLEARVIELEAQLQKKKKVSPSREKTTTSEVFDIYREAFHKLYKTEPPRNGMVNRLIQNMIGRVGLENSKKLVVYYLEQRDAFYTKNFHPIKLLVHSCESLLTRMQTGVKLGNQTAQKIETAKDNQSAVARYLERKHSR